MFAAPTCLHLVGQFLVVEPQELRNFEAMFAVQNDRASFPVAPSCRVDAKVAGGLVDWPTEFPALPE